MKKGKAYTLDYRRKRQGKTNYKTRLKLLSSNKLRVVIRKGLNNILVQLVKFNPSGDNVLISTYTRELLKYGWNGHRGNLSAAYLVGFLCGLKAKKNNLITGIVDLGFSRAVHKSSIFAVVKGFKDAGFDIPLGEGVVPEDDRISGKHIENYAKKLKLSGGYEKQFSKYLKAGLNPEDLSKHFEDVKKKISEKWQ